MRSVAFPRAGSRPGWSNPGRSRARRLGMRDVALVPQRNILEGGLRIAAQHARQPADLLAGNGILLVGIDEEPFLLLREILLCLAHLGPLQVPISNRDLVERGCHQGGGGNIAACRSRWITCVATGAALSPSLSHMRSSCSGFKWPNVPTAPESLPTRMSSAAASKRIRFRSISRKPVQQLESEGVGSGMNAMRAADGGVC